jgi:hypothetical protein
MATLALLCLVVNDAGCRSSKPSQVPEDLCRSLDRGEVDKAITHFSKAFLNQYGIQSVKEGLSDASREFKQHGGVQSLAVVNEDVAGDVAEVNLKITRRNGDVTTVAYKLVREEGTWKIDALRDMTVQNSGPVHPEAAVADVVRWAQQTGVNNIPNWFRQQPKPPFCHASTMDAASLPDEVKYHLVMDTETRNRLLDGIKPVSDLIGCSNVNALILYEGPNVYAGNLTDGYIAITPGANYFSSHSSSDKLSPDLAKFRIFLLREIARQIVPIEKPAEGLNNSDALLRHDLKLTFVAAMASLALDKNPAVLDGTALDLHLYAKPAEVTPGSQGNPTLQQIQDVFGAAKQQSRDVSQ